MASKKSRLVALQFLREQQRQDGSFEIISSNKEIHEPPTATILVVHAFLLDLLHSSDEIPNGIALRVATYLSRTLTSAPITTQLHTIDTYPLFHTIASLYEYDPALVPPETIAACIQFLVDNELAVGGPYVSSGSNKRIPDLTTNIAISRFIHAIGGPFPRLLQYIEHATTARTSSPYFQAAWPLAALLQAMDRAVRNTRVPATYTMPLQHYASTTIDFFYKNPQNPKITYGVPVLQMLHIVLDEHKSTLFVETEHIQPLHTAYLDVVQQAQKATQALDPLIAQSMHAMLTRIINADRNKEIGLLAIRFAPSIASARQYSPDTLRMLGVANLYNWTAYTIYDNFLDDEGEPTLLSTANTALRKSVALLAHAVPTKPFEKLIETTFNDVDAANMWEVLHCRFTVDRKTIHIDTLPNYGDLHSLYQRSLTHSLPLFGTLASIGIAFDSPQATTIFTAFKNYLIIRQLHDDLHDWKEDIKAGHMSYVVTRVLQDCNILDGRWLFASLIPRMERTFMQQTLPAIGHKILELASQAHTAMKHMDAITTPNVIDNLIDAIEHSTEKMLTEHARASSFLAAYRNTQ